MMVFENIHKSLPLNNAKLCKNKSLVHVFDALNPIFICVVKAVVKYDKLLLSNVQRKYFSNTKPITNIVNS